MIAAPLTVEQFAAYFSALWGYSPFPWQQRLLEHVARDGWPRTLDLPTSAGKTAVLDIALFALALDADRPPAERRAPLRTVFVIDRRVVVDQAYERACIIRSKLEEASDGILRVVADRLRSIPGRPGTTPFIASLLRGGMPRESDWARAPDQPCVLVSTVDQVGSRLLFRGYGVTDSMRPVHAGLLGEDVLFLLDEVHLSRPFEETLAAVERFSAPPSSHHGVPHRFAMVRMSATPGTRGSAVFGISDADRHHEILAKRLSASKLARLRVIDTPRNAARTRQRIAAACVEEARVMFDDDRVEVIAVVVNRVDTARHVAALAEAERKRRGWEVQLLTGRMRPLDRRDALRQLRPLVQANRARGHGSRLLLVSTQAIEAGADFDFDGLITECASLDALRQRFGRLDRLGELGSSHAVIIVGSGQVSDANETLLDDPVYGTALDATWKWLLSAARSDAEAPRIDFGISAVDATLAAQPPESLSGLLAPKTSAPILLPTFLDLWTQTAPRPAVEPDVALFLHGPERRAADVQIVWRADLEPDWLLHATAEPDAAGPWGGFLREVVAMCPPTPPEALAVPVVAARTWLVNLAQRTRAGSALDDPDVADVEGQLSADEPLEASSMAPVIIWRGEGIQLLRDPAAIPPGATLLVPACYGGIESGNWNPQARTPVVDRGDEAQLLQRGRVVIRWHPAVVAGWSPTAGKPDVAQDAIEELGPDAERAAFLAWSETLPADRIPAWARLAVDMLRRRRHAVSRAVIPTDSLRADSTGNAPSSTPPVLRASIAPRRIQKADVRRLALSDGGLDGSTAPVEAFTESDFDAYTGPPVPLRVHVERVRDLAHRFAGALGLAEGIASDIAHAGWLHDIGKADPRFQLMLHGGDAVRMALAAEPLAKSGALAGDRATRSRAWRSSGYPAGYRHEVLSAALVQRAAPVIADATDPDLVLHLVASHHGHCRPFPPPVPDPDPRAVTLDLGEQTFEGTTDHDLARLDSGVAERFWRLIRRYGWWRLAWLETMLRLADHRASEEEETDES